MSPLRPSVAGTRRRAPSRAAARPNTVYAVPGARALLWFAIDAVALLALALLAAVAWTAAFGTAEVFLATLGGAALGLVVGGLATWRRWGVLLTTAGSALGYLVCGSALAMPNQSTAYVVPTGRTLTALLQAPVTVWRDVLVITPPIGETGAMLAAPLLATLVATVAGLTIGLRSGRGELAWVPPVLALGLAFAFGTARANFPVWTGVALVAVVVPWAATRHAEATRDEGRRTSRVAWSRLALGAAVLVASLALAVGSAPVTRPVHRDVLREVVQPPLDLRAYASPLQGYRLNLVENKDTVLFHVDRLPEGARIRLATLDSYDGFVAGVANTDQPGSSSGAFQRVGTKVPVSVAGQSIDTTVTIRGYSGVWVPTVGDLASIRFDGSRRNALADDLYFNPASGTALTTAALRPGDSYRLTAVVPNQPSETDLAHLNAASVNLPALGDVPDQVSDLATRYTAGAVAGGDQAMKIERALRLGYFSDGLPDQATSAAGHSFARIRTLLQGDLPMIGDEEQYAVAMMLIARTAGLPARVVYGYRAPAAGSVDVKGSDVSAWVEIAFDGAGWVTFDPTPDHSRVYKDQTPPDENHPRPQVDNPPPPPQKPDPLPPDNTTPQQPKPPQKPPVRVDWALVGKLAAGIGIPLVVIVGPIALIVGWKLRRRRRRATAPDFGARLAGGWSEVVDRARDLGATLPRGLTRSEQAEALRQDFPHLDQAVETRVLAREADAGVFAPDSYDAASAEVYWRRVSDAVRGMRGDRPLWRRVLAWVSLSSLRGSR